MKRVLLFYLVAQIILSIIFTKSELANDGYFEFGFPFSMYRTTNAKTFNNPTIGFLSKGFLLNLLVLFLLSISTVYILRKIKR